MEKMEMMHFWHQWLLVIMPFDKEDKILIKILFNIKGDNAKDIVREFPNKGFVYKLLQKLRITGSVEHRPGK